jgi:hypothetical protein
MEVRTMSNDFERGDRRTLVRLVRELPSNLVALLRAELAQLGQEMSAKAKDAGIGIGLFVGAAVFIFFAVGVLLAAAVLGLATVLPAWLSALIVGVALLVIAGILALVGVNLLKKATPLTPTETMASVREDLDAIKGMGRYDR